MPSTAAGAEGACVTADEKQWAEERTVRGQSCGDDSTGWGQWMREMGGGGPGILHRVIRKGLTGMAESDRR